MPLHLYRIPAFAVAALTCASALTAQSTAARLPPSYGAVIDSIARTLIGSGRVTGLAIGVSRAGRTVYSAAFGTSAAPSKNVLKADDVFRIASVTKQFTAAAILQLVAQRRLSLNDRASRWIAHWPADRASVTVRQLLTHTAGVREARSSASAPAVVLHGARTRQDSIGALIVTDSQDFTPGTAFRYSNAGYFLLGRIVERVSGEPLATYWRRHIFTPLGMQRSGECDHLPRGVRIVDGDERDAEGIAIDAKPIRMADVFSAGAICSTVGDLLIWRRGLESGRVLPPALLAQMNDSTTTQGLGAAYGFGVFLGVLNGHPWAAHNGSINGFVSRLVSYTRDSVTVAVLANTGGADLTAIERAIARAVIGLPDPAPLALSVSAEEQRRFVGTYEDSVHGLVAVVRADGAALVGTLWQLGTTALRHQGGGVFVLASDHDFRVSFRGGDAVAEWMDVTDGVQGTALKRRR
jgi:D-alanyl-D-alanine carboxypeptidase